MFRVRSVLCLLLAAAAAVRPGTSSAPLLRHPDPQGSISSPAHRRPVLALALSGGAARGFAHVGVIKGLAEAGIRPDLIVGSSAGALVGALYARSGSAEVLQAVAMSTDWSEIFSTGFMAPLRAAARGERLESLMRELLDARSLEALPLRFAAVATDLATGDPIAFVRGDAARAVRASAALPGVFDPVRIRDRLFTDGALASPLPVLAARALGASFVIAVDVTSSPRDAGTVEGLAGVLFQSFHIQAARIKAFEAGRADLLITPGIPPREAEYTDADRALLISAGERAVHAERARILSAVERWRRLRAS